MSAADTLLGTYRFRTIDEARKVETIGRKAGFIVSRPRATLNGWEVSLSVEKPDTTRARSTGTLVTLCEGDDLPWMLICEEHAGCMEFHTKREAQSARSAPDEWCEWCMGTETEGWF